ncbi:AGAP011643-PA-like protein [Anopheles sinensis]|uniref:AGAP011643-PA-like protein n=1 Tax=Anopheles sinensis TaxID=74873 RepID=A0A084VK88_ANOSI|nr:AGAP011643-PA-like protein [Anopheles sinensis]
MVLCCVLVVCVLVTTINGARLEAGSGRGEYSTYEEYDDDGPYRRPFEMPDAIGDDGLEDFEDHPLMVDDVLDPITDDDISYSGYYDEDGRDLVSASPVHAGEGSSVVPKANVSVSGTPENGPRGVQQLGPSVEQTTVSADDDIELAVENIHTNMTTVGGPIAMENVTNCAGYQTLPEQPVYIGPSVNFIRKCCPQGQRMSHDGANLISCQQEGPQANSSTMSAIVAKFYEGCIEDLEEDAGLGFSYGNPCATERGLVSFGAHSKDTLYVIQNGSLLVIYERPYDFEVFNSYCLDYHVADGSIMAYVCPQEVTLGADIFAGQLILLDLCLLIAIPLLLLTATFYMIIPELHDLHGRALAMNCVNFAIALLLESFFQHKARGKRMNAEQVVLENYAEYFILATFFWLLVNSANNCFHAWFYAPRAKDVTARWENRRFIGYALVAQLVPLWIILSFSTTSQGNPAIKHYFFWTIMVILVLTLVCLIACYVGLRRVKTLFIFHYKSMQSLQKQGVGFNGDQRASICIPAKKINKVIYMTNYTTLLFVVMATVWTVMMVTYYTTYELPIFYDILFGLQGILMFIIFVCLPKPMRTVKQWLREQNCCCSYVQPTECQPCEPASGHLMARRCVEPMTTAWPDGAIDCFVDVANLDKSYVNNPFRYLPE